MVASLPLASVASLPFASVVPVKQVASMVPVKHLATIVRTYSDFYETKKQNH